MEGIRFIYFDLDDTLLNHRHAEKQALADLCAQYASIFGHLPVETIQETYHQHNVELWRRYASGEISQEDLKRLRFELVLETLAIESAEPTVLNEFYLDSYSRYWDFSQGARQAFHTIADHYPVGILTNGFAAIQHAKLERFPDVRDRLDALVISDEVGYMKPDIRLFDHAAKLAGTDPESILYVGDSYESDIKGALGAGWKCAWYTEHTNGSGDLPGVSPFSRWEQLTGTLVPK